ncbi:hypothetical protein BS47DRAFT_1331124 [Hydnum rufescens UP504]|uniref:Trafficking protein particle complex subunit 12 n=1 Tax=Hydnum rufescens UP504 TaxID=1448309 RepID=A0A9P6DQM0_9AGAM|nr:hypothetical protein BS47DRAFT_1331124 [Hydnum rufescens UP504]
MDTAHTKRDSLQPSALDPETSPPLSVGGASPKFIVPGLRSPSLFLPIPNTDPLTTLLTKHVPAEYRPPRDVTGVWNREETPQLIASNSWRAVARMAQDRILHTLKDHEINTILSLWYLRLSSLARMRLNNQAATECGNLWSILNAVEPVSSQEYFSEHIIPFELFVFRARTKYWASDFYGYLDDLAAIIRGCKRKARRKYSTEGAVWKDRASRVGLMMASQLLELQDYRGAEKILNGLANQSQPSASLLSALGCTRLEAGDMSSAERYFRRAETLLDSDDTSRDVNAALLASAQGDWVTVVTTLEKVHERRPEDLIILNNLAVALLNVGRLQEGIDKLELVLSSSPSTFVIVEPIVFNLATLYELHSATAPQKKRDLLIETAKWSGDGVRTTCLKLPTL